eukprot:1019476-Rhodomonas_salina.2
MRGSWQMIAILSKPILGISGVAGGELTVPGEAGEGSLWWKQPSQMVKGYEQLADVDILEQDPADHMQAMKNPHLCPFLIEIRRKGDERSVGQGMFMEVEVQRAGER